jgi:hypothetical protein
MAEERPMPLHTSKSFTRLETASAKDPLSRSRASTLQGPPVPSILDPLKQKLAPGSEDGLDDGDVFTTHEDTEEESAPELGLPDTFEELPIEIRSLTERYNVPMPPLGKFMLTVLQIPRVSLCQSPP